jgi:hypothetical protein
MKIFGNECNTKTLDVDDGKAPGSLGGEGAGKVENGGDPAAAETPGAGEGSVKIEPKEDMIPVSALKAERNARQLAENNLANLTNHLHSLQPSKKAEAVVDPLSDLSPDTVMTYGEVKQLVSGLEKKFDDRMSSTTKMNTALVSELNVKAEHSDYNDVISNNLVNVLNTNPQMQQAIASASDEFRPLLAYAIGTMDPAYVKQKAGETADVIADRLKKITAMPKSVNAASGSAAETDLSKVIDSMSLEDFEAKIASVKEAAEG